MTGRMLSNLAWEYINTLNQNDKIYILESVENVISSEARKIKDETTERFDAKVSTFDLVDIYNLPNRLKSS